MRKGILSIFTILSLSAFAHNEIAFEELVLSYARGDIKIVKGIPVEGAMNQKAMVTSLWDKVFEEGTPKSLEFAKSELSKLVVENLPVSLKLKITVLKNKLGLSNTKSQLPWQEENWTREEVLSYLSLKDNYGELLDKTIQPEKAPQYNEWAQEFKKATTKDEWSDEQISSLLSFEPNWRRSLRSYKNKVRLYMFCRHNHEHPCLLLMKDKNGNWRRESSGKLWSQPKLGMSRHGLPAHQTNGDTPQGIYTIDSVMPEANRQLVFGKYRRLILNFIKPSRNEKDFLSLMPGNTQGLNWWREGKVARDVGRSLLRIHGTGIINLDPASSWYPFYPTSGCIASRENKYQGVEFHDQRSLLDEMMMAAGLPVQYENEAKLSGLLYVFDINSEERAVELADIEKYL